MGFPDPCAIRYARHSLLISLIAYIDAGSAGLTGGFYRPGAVGQQNTEAGEVPKMFRIREASDHVKAFRVSKDAVIAAAVFGSDDVHIYRLYDDKGEYYGDKKAS